MNLERGDIMKKTWLYATIETLLKENPSMRKDNNAVELAVCREWNGKLLESMKAEEFLNLRDTLGYPSRENITRTKRRVQEDNEDLRG